MRLQRTYISLQTYAGFTSVSLFLEGVAQRVSGQAGLGAWGQGSGGDSAVRGGQTPGYWRPLPSSVLLRSCGCCSPSPCSTSPSSQQLLVEPPIPSRSFISSYCSGAGAEERAAFLPSQRGRALTGGRPPSPGRGGGGGGEAAGPPQASSPGAGPSPSPSRPCRASGPGSSPLPAGARRPRPRSGPLGAMAAAAAVVAAGATPGP